MQWQKTLISYQAFLTLITDKSIHKQLEDIPLFDTDSRFVGVNNMMVITQIAHKLRAKHLRQRKSYTQTFSFMYKGIGSLAL